MPATTDKKKKILKHTCNNSEQFLNKELDRVKSADFAVIIIFIVLILGLFGIISRHYVNWTIMFFFLKKGGK